MQAAPKAPLFGMLKRQQNPGGQVGGDSHHLDQPDQGDHLHQLQPEPQQQVQPENHQKTRIGADPLELFQSGFSLVARSLRTLRERCKTPATSQRCQCCDGSGDASHAQITIGTVRQHDGSHDQATEPGKNRSSEPGCVQAGANRRAGGQLRGKCRMRSGRALPCWGLLGEAPSAVGPI